MSIADTPVVVDNLAESTLPDQEVLTVLDNYAEAGVEQTQVLEETSSDVAEAPLVVEDAELTDNVSGVPEPLVEETPLESTIDESLGTLFKRPAANAHQLLQWTLRLSRSLGRYHCQLRITMVRCEYV